LSIESIILNIDKVKFWCNLNAFAHAEW
jgi:hypothetical protein